LNSVKCVNNTDHAAILVDQANLRNPNPSVDAYSTFDTLTSGKIKNGAARSYSMKVTFMYPSRGEPFCLIAQGEEPILLAVL
jgi:hypothetical protein